MRKVFLILLLLIFGLVVAVVADPVFKWGPVEILPNLYTIGGGAYLDATSGGINGNWGIGGDYTALKVNLRFCPALTNIDFGYGGVIFQYYQAKSVEASYNLTPYFKSLNWLNDFIWFVRKLNDPAFNSQPQVEAISTGAWIGQRLEDGHIVGGIVLKTNVNLLPQ